MLGMPRPTISNRARCFQHQGETCEVLNYKVENDSLIELRRNGGVERFALRLRLHPELNCAVSTGLRTGLALPAQSAFQKSNPYH